MARPLHIEYEDADYHTTLQGNNRRIIFKQDSDRERFIQKLAESVQRFDIRLYLSVLLYGKFCQYGGLTQRQAAKIVGIRSGVAVCLQIRKVDELMKRDRSLKRHLAEIEELLRQREKKYNLFPKG